MQWGTSSVQLMEGYDLKMLIDRITVWSFFCLGVLLFLTPVALVWWEIAVWHLKLSKRRRIRLRTLFLLVSTVAVSIRIFISLGGPTILAILASIMCGIGFVAAVVIIEILAVDLLWRGADRQKKCRDLIRDNNAKHPGPTGDRRELQLRVEKKDRRDRKSQKWWIRQSPRMRLGRFGHWL